MVIHDNCQQCDSYSRFLPYIATSLHLEDFPFYAEDVMPTLEYN